MRTGKRGIRTILRRETCEKHVCADLALRHVGFEHGIVCCAELAGGVSRRKIIGMAGPLCLFASHKKPFQIGWRRRTACTAPGASSFIRQSLAEEWLAQQKKCIYQLTRSECYSVMM